ncbi:MAG: hypothetical protein ACXWFG_15890 [Methylobacter sp.]
MKNFPLRLDRYFFTNQEVVANPDFIQDDESNPTQLELIVEGHASRLEDHGQRYGITARVGVNQNDSKNVPYFFTIMAFGIISIKDDTLGQATIEGIIETSGIQLILGAIRERLADMTARGPWELMLLDFIPITIKIES